MSRNAGDPVPVPVDIYFRVEAETDEAREWALAKARRALLAAGFHDLDKPAKPALRVIRGGGGQHDPV